MIVVNEDLLNYFRSRPRCEVCQVERPSGLDAHHVQCRGMGGGSRLDVALNLCSLCRDCHQKFHDGKIRQEQLWQVVADREGLMAWYVARDAVWALLRRAKA